MSEFNESDYLSRLRNLWTADLEALIQRLESGEYSLGFRAFFSSDPEENKRRAGLARQVIADRASTQLT